MTIRKTSLALLFTGFAALALACGDDNKDAVPDEGDSGTSFTDPGAGEKDASTGGGTDGGTTGEETDGGEEDVDAGPAVDADGGVCDPTENAEGFYLCKPTTNLQFLNQFVPEARGISQLKFDNETRIPGYTGTLPNLP
jgi:hypothetical protein